MAKNKFDKEKIPTIESDAVPMSFYLWSDKTTYDVREKRGAWWECPKCGSGIHFDSVVEEFDEDIGENQFTTVYSWWCEECGAQGAVFAVVNPLYITIEQADEDEDED